MVPLLALVPEYETAWIVALVAGAAVLIVVVVLLTWLYRLVVDIDHGVREVWEAATRLASNTATTWQLGETAKALEEIKAEALRHDELLNSKL